MAIDLTKLTDAVLTSRQKVLMEHSLLVGISGIDASGKGLVTAKLAEKLSLKGFRVANINVDGWLNLPDVRFNSENLAGNFYQKAIRFEEMFEKLILPLKRNRTIHLMADLAEETAREFRKHEYAYQNIDIILLEGIFLFKKALINHFDFRIWIECSFEIALQRAIERSQENLSPAETVKTYQTIYFPAQKIHFLKDNPKQFADLIYHNDH